MKKIIKIREAINIVTGGRGLQASYEHIIKNPTDIAKAILGGNWEVLG